MKKAHRSPALRWHESIAVRSIIFVTVTFGLGHVASVFLASEGLEATSKLSYNSEIQAALDNYLDDLKSLNKLERLFLLETVQSVAQPPANLKETDLIEKIQDVSSHLQGHRDPKMKMGEDSKNRVAWTSEGYLEAGPYIITFAPNDIQLKFRKIEDLSKRYLVYGDALKDHIIPKLRFNYIAIMTLTFAILIFVVAFITQSYNIKISYILKGFSQWSQENNVFRFKEDQPGEFRLLASQFNLMADTVEISRRRSMYLEKMASWQSIAKKIAHEIKNPLTPIRSLVSNLPRQLQYHPETFPNILAQTQSIIEEEIQRLTRIVDSFTQFSALPSPSFKVFDLSELCRQIAFLEGAAFPLHSINCADTEAILIEADQDLIKQIIINLVKNAAEALGVNAGYIILTIQPLDDTVLIHVDDNGPGIPPDIQARIFEAYVSTKFSSETSNMGLGLAICKKIALDHGGDLTFSSRSGHTRFTLLLPKRRLHDSRDAGQARIDYRRPEQHSEKPSAHIGS